MKRLFFGVVLTIAFTLTLEAAKITSISGNPQVLKPQNKKWQIAAQGATVVNNDKIRCSDKSRAEILLDNGHRIKVWPKSEISLDKVDGEHTRISLAMGRLRSMVRKLKGKEKFEVKTPVAVCSVRGTDFSVEFGEDKRVKVEVYEGLVAAREERTGAEVNVSKGEFTQIQQNLPPAPPQEIPPEQPEAVTPAAEEENTLSEADIAREEARSEIFQELSRESVMARAAEEIKLAEYQNGKALVDVSGKRVRLEEYIIRTQPNEFKYVVLNERADNFNFGKMLFTFNTDLPDDLTLATKTMFTSEGAAKPAWWLTDVLTVMSNTVDQVNEEASGGDMFVDNPAYPGKWTLGFAKYTFSVNSKPWWEYSDANHNGKLDGNEISYYNIANDPSTKLNFSNDFQYDATAGKYYILDSNNERLYFNETTQPSGSEAFHFLQKNNYTDTQWITAADYVINDEGKVFSLADLQNKTSSELEQKAYESNFERIYESSVFNGRKIDLVFSARLLIDAGIINLPNPQNISQ